MKIRTARLTHLTIATSLMLAMGLTGRSIAQVAPPPGSLVGVPPLPDDSYPPRWPMDIPLSNGGDILVFQPQLEDFQGDMLRGRAAVQFTPAPGQQPQFGAVWLQSRVSTDRVARTVRVLEVQITQSRFPNSDPATIQTIASAIPQALMSRPATLSLDQLLSMLQTVQTQQQQAENFQTTPPIIVFRDHPAVKVQYDGAPRLMQVANSPLMRVVNTPFFVVLDPQSRTYFLKGGGRWYVAPDPLGPFRDVASTMVPPPVAQLADASGYQDPQQPISDAEARGVEIVTATQPTELVWTDGPQQLGTIPGTGLLYVTNTDANLFRDIQSQQLYLLISGRWYTAGNQNGPWNYLPPDRLPPDFARIPANSEKGDVLAQVAGTPAARDAVADTMIPQTATLDRANYVQPTIVYDGAPQFDVIEGSPCRYAVNTSSAVLLVNGRYYACHEGVWYLSSTPTGHWDLCTVVPQEIYRIPPSCPIYSVRYVYVYGYTPDVVYCGYLPGYVGCYAYNGVVVYGTGYYYRPWIGRTYCARPWTYGYAAHYNGYVGSWGFDFALALGGGSRWVGGDDRAWGRREHWFGYGGYRPVVFHRDVRDEGFRNAYLSRLHEGRAPVARAEYSHNLYDRRPDVRRVDAGLARREDLGNAERRTAAERAGARESRPLPRNDMYTDRSGNIYRRTDSGWERRDQNQWRPEKEPPQERTNQERRGPNREQPAREQPAREPAKEQPNRGQPAREVPAREQPAREQPAREQPAREQPDRSNDRARQTPRQGNERQANERQASNAPDRSGGQRDLNRDYQARQAGSDRLRNYERPSSPPREQQRNNDQERRGNQNDRGSNSDRGSNADRGSNSGRSSNSDRSGGGASSGDRGKSR